MENNDDILMRKHHKLRISKTTLPEQSRPTSYPKKQALEDSFHAVVNQHSREACFVVKLDGEIVYCNAATKELLGIESSLLICSNIKHLIPVNQWTVFRAALRASEIDSEQSTVIHCDFLDAKNNSIFCSLAVNDERHHPLVEGYVIHVQDRSHLQQTKEKLMLHQFANELIKEAVVIVDVPDMKVVFANQAFYHLSGFTKAEVMEGKLNLFKSPYSDLLFANPTSLKVIERFQKAIKTRKKFVGKIHSKKKSGEVFYHRMDLSPVVNAQGELTHYVAGLKEIKRRKTKPKS